MKQKVGHSDILVVDGDHAILDVIERMFSHFDVKIDCVTSAASALDRLRSHDYRTMITDLDMPDMDGLELARRVREQFPDLHIVLFTGNTTSHIMDLALHAKVSEVHFRPRGFGDMLKSIMNREPGKTFLLEQS